MYISVLYTVTSQQTRKAKALAKVFWQKLSVKLKSLNHTKRKKAIKCPFKTKVYLSINNKSRKLMGIYTVWKMGGWL